jgi:hypothetical protein
VRWIPQVGGIAQLGEHLLCKQGVIGSIPIVSTTIVCFANDEAPMPSRAGFEATIGPYRGMSRIRFDHVPGQSVPGCVVMPIVPPGWVALFFVTVNQVLVRLWARVLWTGVSWYLPVRWRSSD